MKKKDHVNQEPGSLLAVGLDSKKDAQGFIRSW